MNFLLDTNAVSEWVKRRPNPGLIRWMQSADEDRIFLSVITLAELRHGVERLPEGRRRAQLEPWIKRDLPLRFDKRILPIDEEIAQAWGVAVAMSESVGRPLNVMDAFLLATAKVRDLTLITRNVNHFPLLQALLNPWI